ncbi:hypothetical protein P3339_13835 [Microbulbifer sp. MLAF003]|uniref:DUF6443 domain-containing protein n=1 Tax=Microbulbifer sp. MLAF003 TaxID=3032582 RepID=UPI0024ADEB94|nr:hypothetical protein [Microbulbifer sp. MLAF003]WHI49550.1 hypothetical protein P3339_13835 [Microbulbifer sp. MLAF003]
MSISRHFLLLSFLLISISSYAEEIRDYYAEPGLNPFKETVNDHFNEHIDVFSGGIQLKYTDIHIPGNGGMDVNINRVYNSPQTYSTPLRTAYGVGWTMHFGRIVVPYNYVDRVCSQASFDLSTRDNPSLEHADGGREVLVLNSMQADGSLITKSNWRAECIDDANGILVTAPDGKKYTMDYLDTFQGESSWFTTKIVDVHGNWISIEYEKGSTGASYIKNIYRSEDGLVASYQYEKSPNGIQLLKSISAKGLKVYYKFDPVSPDYPFTAYNLVKVTRPDKKSWVYSYYDNEVPPPEDDDDKRGVGQFAIKSVKYPDGAKISYTYQRIAFDMPWGLDFGPGTTAIATKTLSDIDGGSAQWVYEFKPYSEPENSTASDGASGINYLDKTTVKGPDGKTVYTHYGTSYNFWGFTVYYWKAHLIGLRISEKKYNKQGDLIYRKLNSWKSEGRIISYEDFSHGLTGTKGHIDDATYVPILKSVSESYDGENGSRAIFFFDHDQFGNPRTIKEFSNLADGEKFRTSTLDYDNDTGRWILGKVKEEVVKMGDQTSTTSRTFYRGEVKSETVNGVITQYEYTNDGDIESITDANNNVVTFSEYKRGIAQKEEHPENVTVLRTVNDSGTIGSVTDAEGRLTSYVYDFADRIKSVDFPIHEDITISYEDNARTLERGNYKQVDYFDNIGRLIKTDRIDISSMEVISTRSEYDVFGRKTYQSIPYAEIEVGGINYEYDIIGRLIKETNVDDSYKTLSYKDETVTITDERGKVTKIIYQNVGLDESWIREIQQPEDIGTVFTRNLIGQPVQIRQFKYSGSGAWERNYIYNDKFLLEKKFDPEIGTDQHTSGITKYTYDDVGNLISSQVEDNDPVFYRYDNLYRLKTIDYPDGADDTSFVYDNNGKITQVSSGVSLWDLEYDDNDNLVKEILKVDSSISREYVFKYDYDDLDNLDGITYPNDLYVDYMPDAFGRPSKAGSYAHNVQYYPSGQIESFTYGNGKSTNFTLNERLFPEALLVDGLVDLEYGYDEVGNVLSIVDKIDNSKNISTAYDDLNRLISASGAWGRQVMVTLKRVIFTIRTLKIY